MAPFEWYAPFHATVLTSRFNAPRDYSFAPHRLQLHEGIDCIDGEGLNVVHCGRAGTVTRVDFDRKGYGNYAVIDFGYGWSAWYAHFEVIHVRQGQSVVALQALGVAGSTGMATGLHTHLTLCNPTIGLDNYVIPKVVNPEPYLVNW